MNADAYNLIIDTISHILEAKQYHAVDTDQGSYFTNGTAAIRVRYNEDHELFYLEQAVMEGEAPGESWKILSSWLFGKDAPLKEAKSIANDFEDTLREFLGVKPAAAKTTTAADLPAKEAPGDDPTPAVLAGRFLTIFPQFKNEYQTYTTSKGTFLYVHFFEEIAVPHLCTLLDTDDKKRLVKFFDMMNHIYCNGDQEARAVVSAVLLAGALRGNAQRMATAKKYMETLPHLKTAAEFAVKVKA
ncbi:MAG: hypothetical protein IKU10_08120 [Clostridia bacterium]|nr:hypothetical protein [Clostridia bacterium]